MSCIFVTNDQGDIISVRKPDGSPSELYQEALSYTGDKQQAIDMVAITQTEDFKEVVNYNSQEPSLNQVLDYSTQLNANQNPLNAQQEQDLRNSLLSVDVNSVAEFQSKLKQAFYSGNIFAPTLKKLKDSGIYSDYEARNIVNDMSLQQKIKSAVEALNNTEYEEDSLPTFIGRIEKGSEFNSFGKITALNPYIVENTILQTLGAPETRQQFDDRLNQIEYPQFLQNVNPDTLYNEMRQYVRAEELTDVDGQIVNSTTSISSALELGVNPEKLSSSVINDIINTPDAVLEQNPQEVKTLLVQIEKDMASAGVDVVGIKDKADDPNLKTFLQILYDFANNPSVENTQSLTEAYADFFDAPIENKSRVLDKLPTNRDYVYLETNKAEDLLLVEDNLLKVKNNVYIRVNRADIDTLYSSLETFPGKAVTRTEVENNASQIEDISNPENAEELYLMKRYFDAPLNFTTQQDTAQEEMNNEIFERSNADEFIPEFQAEALNQKQKDSQQWKNFYSNFEINSKGINIKNNDPITLNTLNRWIEEIKPSIAKDLKQYSLISRQLPILGETEINAETSLDSQRALAVNYPSVISKITADNYRITESVVILKNPIEPIVRIGNSVYESVEAKGNLGLYVKLPAYNNSYKQYKIPAPQTDISLNDYNYLDNENSGAKTIKKNETIIKENFNC